VYQLRNAVESRGRARVAACRSDRLRYRQPVRSGIRIATPENGERPACRTPEDNLLEFPRFGLPEW